MSIENVLNEIAQERAAQDATWGVSDFEDGVSHHWAASAQIAKDRCDDADALGTTTWAMVLEEESLEALCETDPAKLREELVQVAAVAVAWIEALDRRNASTN